MCLGEMVRWKLDKDFTIGELSTLGALNQIQILQIVLTSELHGLCT